MKEVIKPGTKFGRFKYLQDVEKAGAKRFVLCECVCGKKEIKRLDTLKSIAAKSICKCNERHIGKKFNELTVLSLFKVNGYVFARCKCSCGNHPKIRLSHVTSGDIKSCGCLSRKYLPKEIDMGNFCRSDTYSTFVSMFNRCYNTHNSRYSDYGGRGIFVCRRWRKSLFNFIKDVGERPSKSYSIDRIDNNGPYAPWNCKWSTRGEQQRNMRSNKIIYYKGDSKCLTEWCEELKIPYDRVHTRLSRGWCLDDAFSDKTWNTGKRRNT